jgi:hypothetical protein
VDNTINTVKLGAKRDYEDAYSKVLQGPYPAHPDFSHTMGNCRGLKSIYRSDPRKRMRGGGKDGERDDQWDDKKGDEEEKENEEQDKKNLVTPTKIPTEPSALFLAAR